MKAELDPPAPKAPWIPPGSDLATVLVRCSEAYLDHPLAGHRIRIETQTLSTMLGAEEADLDIPGMFDDSARVSSTDIEADLEREAFAVRTTESDSTFPGHETIRDLRLLLKDELFYSRVDETQYAGLDLPWGESPSAQAPDEPDRLGLQVAIVSANRPRWDQLPGLPIIPEVVEFYAHPERLIRQLSELLTIPSSVSIKSEPDQSLPGNAAGCVILVTIRQMGAFYKLMPNFRQGQLGSMVDNLLGSLVDGPEASATMRFLLSRDSGYIQRVEMEIKGPGMQTNGRVIYYGHRRAVRVGAPPADEVNTLLAPETVAVNSINDQLIGVTFLGRDAEEEALRYRISMGGDLGIPPISIGDRAVVDYLAPYPDDGDLRIVTRYRSEAPGTWPWRTLMYPEWDKPDEDSAPGEDMIRNRTVEIIGVEDELEHLDHRQQFSIVFDDAHQETVELGEGLELWAEEEELAMPVIGDRLTAYCRQTPAGPVMFELCRGDKIIWMQT